MNLMIRRLIPALLLAILSIQPGIADSVEPQHLDVTLSSDETMSITRFGNNGNRILWIPSEYGIRKERHYELLDALSKLQNEVWLFNPHESYFVPPGRSSYTGLPVEDIAELINKSLPPGNRNLFIVATGRGAALALLAIRQWQNNTGDTDRFGGIIMLHPNFQAKTPTPGEAVHYLPVVDSIQLPMFIIQPRKSNKYWYLQDLVTRLSNSGNIVYTQVIDQAGDGYHSRPELTDIEEQKYRELPRHLSRAMRVLTRTGKPASRHSPTLQQSWDVSPVPETLQPYPGDSMSPDLQLTDTSGKKHRLRDYYGKVVVLNFWATWCPPCVEEIPSLGRLQITFSKEDLVVLSVDVGENKKEVDAFLERVPAEFPVMLDPDGSTVKPWKVVAFPTTFIIAPNGTIRLAYYGGMVWDKPSLVSRLRALIKQEQHP